jgi:lipopolysaccharide transport system ATP-binding protein
MNDIAIRAENLGKRYRIGKRERYQTLRDTLTDTVTAPFRWLRHGRSANGDGAPDHIWALKDVSFEIPRGEVVGIIGRNGAGKSTLLKVLSRITEPTEGCAEIHGRVGSLLEVGTGFHPELTGRENIYLNGAILGMRKAEIARKFDEIVAFAEIEKFLDTPVKHFSSGMYMRLAFAVAAHLDPEILVVDEVLAVGDAQFQSKCLNKMQDVSRHGRTVVFVSHSMPAIARLCPRTILLDRGGVARYGPSDQVIGFYLRSGLGTSAARAWDDPQRAPGNDIVRLLSVRVRNTAGDTVETIGVRESVGIEMEFEVLKPGSVLAPNFHLHNEEGVCLFVAHEQDPVWQRRGRPCGRYRTTGWIPGDLLADGTHFVTAVVATLAPLAIHFFEEDVVAFQTIDGGQGDSARGDFSGRLPGVIRPLLEFTSEFIEEPVETDSMPLSSV